MRRTTTMTTAGLLGLALLAPTTAPSASGAPPGTCANRPATIIGTGPTVTGTEGPDVIVTGPATTVRALGGDDAVCVTTPRAAGPVDVDAGPGDDDVLVPGDLAPGSTLAGGEGRDLFVAGRDDDHLRLDLKLRRVAIGSDVSAATGFEDGFLMAPEVVIVGDMHDNDLRFHGCQAMIRGGNGDDYLSSVSGDPYFHEHSFGCDASASMWGGPGADRLRGGQGPDLLDGESHADRVEGRGGDDVVRGGQGRDVVFGGKGADRVKGGRGHDRLFGNRGHDVVIGGKGFDRAKGSRGRDRCIAERERSCER